MSCADLFLAFIAILFPPIAVWIKSGLCSADSLINICLCCLGYLPGLIHAWYIIARNPEREYDYEPIDNERGERVTYYYVSHTGNGNRQYGTQGRQPKPQQPKPQQPPGIRTAPSATPPAGPSQGANVEAGPSQGGDDGAAPPPYSDVVKGDHKLQTQD